MTKPPQSKNPSRNINAQFDRARTSGEHPVEHSRLAIMEGPLPPPAILRDYDSIIPGAAERILQMAECEYKHRHSLEDRELNANIQLNNEKIRIYSQEVELTSKMALRAQSFGFFLSLLAIVGASVLAFYGHDGVAMVFGAIPCGAL